MTHRGLTLHPIVANLMHLHLTLFTGIVPREWVAVHRKHHQFSDKEGDPHSPLLHGMWTVLFGNFWMYRNEKNNEETVRKYTPEWKADLIDKIPGNSYGVLGGLAIFTAVFGWIAGPLAWLGHIVFYILLNAMINSLGHTIGYRNWKNQATNLQWVAFLTAGEGLHNNHHEFPTSARFSCKGFEIDPAWPLIRLMMLLGLAKVNDRTLARAA